MLAGGNAVAIRFSNRELAPVWGASVRFALAALILLAAMAALRLALPSRSDLVGIGLYGVLQFAGGFGLTYFGLVEIHAGLGQTILALVPLATLLLAVGQRQERMDGSALIGTVSSLAGVAWISSASLGGAVRPLSLFAMLGAVVCFSQALVVIRRFAHVHPVTMNAGAMSFGAAILFVASLARGEVRTVPTLAETWVALAYVVAIGSVVVFLLVVFVTQSWGASRASYILVLVPFVTVVLSAWLDDEPIGTGLIGGGLLIVAGVYVGAIRRRAQRPVPTRAG